MKRLFNINSRDEESRMEQRLRLISELEYFLEEDPKVRSNDLRQDEIGFDELEMLTAAGVNSGIEDFMRRANLK